jgi:uncharacterized protein GlcG (DUF336 family)
MPNVVKKYYISFELAQEMVDAAVAKAKEIGVSENVVILDDGGILKAFIRMDGAPIPTIEMAQNKAYTALLGVSTQDFFNFIQGDPSLLAGIPALPRIAAWGGGVTHQGEWRTCRGDRGERGAHGAERHRLRVRSPIGRIRSGACGLSWKPESVKQHDRGSHHYPSI